MPADSPLVRSLAEPDLEAVTAFLTAYASTSMFILGNARREGLTYSGRAYSGRYWGAFGPDGALRGVIAHYWNGNILLQAPQPEVLLALADTLRSGTDRPVAGALGDAGQVDLLLHRLGLAGRAFALNASEGLFDLDLADLRVPEREGSGALRVRPAREAGREVLTAWIRAYEIEALKTGEGPGLDAEVARRVDGLIRGDDAWVLVDGDRPVSLSGFNARLAEMVQIGPVWTPPEHRSRGYARHLVAASLRAARRTGIARAILFTNSPAAVRAYESIGFRRIGAFRVALLRDPVAMA